ncbi:MAG: helix-turn-helix domain-containing protein [Proteobacteria bacterium]|nr:helix-turn-helix domain-containing protein [Pseudomonadota bacterium]
MPRKVSEEKYWIAVVEKNKATDGSFVYAVKSTGIYCRPGCASRLPNRENVLFFDYPEAAAAAGFRPCKRCLPDTASPTNKHNTAVLHACQLLSREEQEPSLQELASASGFSPHYFQRLFKKEVGITPKQYAKAQRMKRLLHSLKKEATVTDAIYAAGFHSSSRAYAQSTEDLGMSPSTYRNGGKGLSIQQASAPCNLGWVLVGTTQKGICFIALGDEPGPLLIALTDRFPQAHISPAQAEFSINLKKIVAFIDGRTKDCGLPLEQFRHLLKDTDKYHRRCLKRDDLDFNVVAERYMQLGR